MKKGQIIAISIVSGVLVLLLAMFGFVFCLRKEKVTFIGDAEKNLNITSEQIIKTAGFKHGRSIFMLNKDKATQNIERAYPYIKVVEIKTISAIQVEIRVRARSEMYYIERLNQFYIVDEELKVLRIVNREAVDSEAKLSHLTKIVSDKFGITGNTVASDFLRGQADRNLFYNLFNAMYTCVKIDGEFLTREQISALIPKIEFDTGYSLDEAYTRIILTTSEGVKIDIGKPEQNLQYKINVCFSAFNILSEDEKKSGTIKFLYLADGTVKAGYFKEN